MKGQWVRVQSIAELRTGDLVRHVTGGDSYVVEGHFGDRATAVSTKDMTNPIEWNVYRPEIDPETKLSAIRDVLEAGEDWQDVALEIKRIVEQ